MRFHRGWLLSLSVVLVAVLLLSNLTHTAYAAPDDYYVSTTGSDANIGSASSPWKTVAYAASHVPANTSATIHIAAGTYVEKSIIELPPSVSLVGAGQGTTILKADHTSADSDFAHNSNGITWDTFYAQNTIDGAWLRFPRIDLGAGFSNFFARSLVSQVGGSLEVRLDSPNGALIGTLTLQTTSVSWGQEQRTSLSGASGKHDIYVLFKNGANIGKFSAFLFSNRTTGTQDQPDEQDTSTIGADIFLNANRNGGELVRLWSDPYDTNGNQAVSDLTIDGSSRALWAGMLVRGRSNVHVHDVTFRDIGDHGLRVLARSALHLWPKVPLTGIELNNNTFINCSNNNTTQDTGNGSSGALEISGLRNAKIHHNVIQNTSSGNGFGMKFTAGGWLYGIEVYNNTIISNYLNPGNNFTIEFWNLYDDSQVYNNKLVNGWISIIFGNKGSGTNSVYVHHNYLTYGANDAYQAGIETNLQDVEIAYNIIERSHVGIIAFDGTTNNNLRVHHNVIRFPTGEEDLIGNGALGIQLIGANSTARNLKVYNNIFQNLDQGLNIWIGTFENADVRNNAFVNVHVGFFGKGTNLNFAYNAVQASDKQIDGDVIAGSGNIAINSLSGFGFTLSGNVPDPYYRLQSGSPLMNAGSNVGFPYVGSAPDIGPIEDGSATWSVGDGSPVIPPALPPLPPAGTPYVFDAGNNGGSSGVIFTNGNLGFADDGDWVRFRQLNLSNAIPSGNGYFKADMGLESNAGLSKHIEVRLDSVDGTLVANLVPQSTGGWENFQVQTTPLTNVSGVHDIYVVFKGGNGIGNFRQFLFSSYGSVTPRTLSSQEVNEHYGISYDQGTIVSTDDGDWVKYNQVNFAQFVPDGSGYFSARIGVPDNVGNTKKIEVHLDSVTGPLAATLVVQGTGGWSTYQSQSTALNGVSGIRDVYIVFKGGNGIGNLQQFSFGNRGSGLKGEYYNNTALTGANIFSRLDATVDFYWGDSPGTDVNADNFSVRWTGKLQPTVSGSYSFATLSDDGVRLWINGQLLIDNWTNHSPTTNTSSAITLTAGQQYDITMEFYEASYGALARLYWIPPGQGQAIVPQAVLYT